MASAAHVVQQWLKAQAGKPSGLGLFHTHMPDLPVLVLVVTLSEGAQQGRGHRTGKNYQQTGIQFRVRGGSEATAHAAMQWARAKAEALMNPVAVVVDSVSYTLHPLHEYGTPATLGTPNKKKQPQYTQDYRTVVRN